jgi:2,4-didehydro-3-deoxy-L-rhamnonate hydrolase
MGFRLTNIDGRAALLDDRDRYHDLESLSGGAIGSDPMTALADEAGVRAATERLADAEPTGELADVVLGAPVPRPRNVFAVGLNYSDHAAESNLTPPEQPLVFTKFPSSICGPATDIELRSEFVDYEVEVIVVIGRGGHDISEADAWSHVIGLTMGQDVSDRRMQFASSPPHFDLAKSFDTFGPMGPWLRSLDGFDDPDSLRLTCSVNGDLRQDGNTGDLIFGVPKLISYLSHITTLSAGDIIWTGTPAGVGAATGAFLRDGDVVETSVTGLGTMTNRCVRIGDHA